MEPDCATPLDEDEAAELMPSHITTRAALNAWEQANITAGVTWLQERRKTGTVLTEQFLKEVHQRMFGATWKWAGKYRKTGKNIGVPASDISGSIRDLVEDTNSWIENSTFGTVELGARFHHRLVQIHPFPNGNGRHARLMTDELLAELGATLFTWGSGNIDKPGAVRIRYIDSLKEADRSNLGPLIAFVKS